MIFELFRRSRAVGVNFVRSVQNVGRSYDFGTSELPHNHAKSMKNRCAGVFAVARRRKRARAALRGRPGASWSQLGETFGWFPAALGSPGAPKIAPGPAFRFLGPLPGTPGPLPGTSRRVPETALSGQSRPKRDFKRFFVDFSSILALRSHFRHPFRGSPARFSSELAIVVAQIRRRKKRPSDPQRASWHLRCLLASCCARGFRRLFVRPHLVAYIQVHLV